MAHPWSGGTLLRAVGASAQALRGALSSSCSCFASCGRSSVASCREDRRSRRVVCSERATRPPRARGERAAGSSGEERACHVADRPPGVQPGTVPCTFQGPSPHEGCGVVTGSQPPELGRRPTRPRAVARPAAGASRPEQRTDPIRTTPRSAVANGRDGRRNRYEVGRSAPSKRCDSSRRGGDRTTSARPQPDARALSLCSAIVGGYSDGVVSQALERPPSSSRVSGPSACYCPPCHTWRLEVDGPARSGRPPRLLSVLVLRVPVVIGSPPLSTDPRPLGRANRRTTHHHVFSHLRRSRRTHSAPARARPHRDHRSVPYPGRRPPGRARRP
jgi:hypothetical protein